MKSNRNHSLLRNSSLKQKAIAIENQNSEVPKEEELYNFSSKSTILSQALGTSKRSNKLQLDEFNDYNDIHDSHQECNQVLSSASIMMQNAQMLSDLVQKIKLQNQVSDFNTQQTNLNLPPSQYHSQSSCGFKTQRQSVVPDSQLTLPSNFKLKENGIGLSNVGNEQINMGKTKVFNLKQSEQIKETNNGKKQSKSQLNQSRHVKSSSHFINQALNKDYLKFRMRQSMIKNQLLKYVNQEQLEAQIANPKKQKLHIPSLNESKSCNQLPMDQSFLNQHKIIQQYAQQHLTGDLSREIYTKELQLTNENLGHAMRRAHDQLKSSSSKTKIHKGTSIASQILKSEFGGCSTERGSLLQVCGNNQFQNCLGIQNSERIFVQDSQQVIHQKIKETAPFNPNLCKSQLALGFKNQISAKKLYRIVRDSQDQPQKSFMKDEEQIIDDLLAIGQKVDSKLLNKISAIGERKLPRLSCKQNVHQNVQAKEIQSIDYQMKDSFLIQSSTPVKEKVVSQVRESHTQNQQKSNSREKSRGGGGRPILKQAMSKSQVHKQNPDQIKDNMIAQCNKDLEFIKVDDRSCNVSPKQLPCKPHFKLMKQKFDENQRGNKTQRQTKTYIIRSSSKKVESLKNAIDAYRDVMMIDEDHMLKHSTILKPSKLSQDYVYEGEEEEEGEIQNDQQKLINKRKSSQSFRQSLTFRETLQNMLAKKHMDVIMKAKEGVNADLE